MSDPAVPDMISINGEQWHDDGLHELRLKVETELLTLELTCHAPVGSFCRLGWFCPQGCEQEPCVLPGDDPDNLRAYNHDGAGIVDLDSCGVKDWLENDGDPMVTYYAGEDVYLSSLADYRFVYRFLGEDGVEWQLVPQLVVHGAEPVLVLHQTVPFVPEPEPVCGDDFEWRGEELYCQLAPDHDGQDHSYTWPASNRRITWASVVT